MCNLSIYSYSRKEIFSDFFKKRSNIIQKFGRGEITKKQFLEDNYNLVRRSSIIPFLRIDSYEKGMYNYQYYNVLAKYYNMLAHEAKDVRKNQKYYVEYLNKSNNFYHEKDRTTLEILKYLDFKGVEAYFIEMESKRLNGELYEIALLNYDEAIFHSKAKWLLDILREEGVFIDSERKSLIDGYINERY